MKSIKLSGRTEPPPLWALSGSLPLYIAIIVGPLAAAISGAQNSDFPQRKSALNRYCFCGNTLGYFTLVRLGARLGFQAKPEPSHKCEHPTARIKNCVRVNTDLSKIVSRFTRTERSSETANKWTCMPIVSRASVKCPIEFCDFLYFFFSNFLVSTNSYCLLGSFWFSADFKKSFSISTAFQKCFLVFRAVF